jgi:subtilisin family serine protease
MHGRAATDGLAADPSYGRARVELVAPGQDILSTARNGDYELRSGSSMAAAEVSGGLVLMAGARRDLGGAALRTALLAAARPTTLPVAAGALDVAAALRRVLPPGRWHSGLSATRARRAARRASSRLRG